MAPHTLGYQEIRSILPQDYPFILIDRIESIQKGKSLIAIKNITSNEWPFENFSQHLKVFPETLVIEAAAQAALILYYVSRSSKKICFKYVLGRIKAEFFSAVEIGKELKLNVLASKMLERQGYMDILIKDQYQEIASIEIIYKVS
ncbi:MAG: hypothetical protein NUV91_03550, partial [Candidatus Omnitrophica bacterium]|nr:hypothetical protein [Candidatus Omnitrophota bacterium]